VGGEREGIRRSKNEGAEALSFTLASVSMEEEPRGNRITWGAVGDVDRGTRRRRRGSSQKYRTEVELVIESRKEQR